MKKYIHGAIIGSLATAILTLYLHEPAPRMTTAEIIDAFAVVIDGNFYPPDYEIAQAMPTPPTPPKCKTSTLGCEIEIIIGAF